MSSFSADRDGGWKLESVYYTSSKNTHCLEDWKKTTMFHHVFFWSHWGFCPYSVCRLFPVREAFPMVLVANKVDLVHLRKVTTDQGQEMAAKHNVSKSMRVKSNTVPTALEFKSDQKSVRKFSLKSMKWREWGSNRGFASIISLVIFSVPQKIVRYLRFIFIRPE